MGKYTLREGHRKDRRWPYAAFVFAPLLLVGYFYIGGGNAKEDKAQVASSYVAPVVEAVTREQLEITKPLPWPDYGQAAYGVAKDGVLAQSNKNSEPVPIASLAKVITALVILDKKPLLPGEQGPMITLTEADVALYQEYIAKNGTVVPVQAGEQISQYQALQAMLLPSANNIADTLVIWAFGSVESYNEHANTMLKKLSFSKTTVADASGYSSMTKSTADEMVKISILYLQNPVLKEIASQTEATIPFAGKIYSSHSVVNEGEVIGLKIGYTEAAGRTFLAADIRGENQDEISVVAVLGAENKYVMLQDIKTILKSGNNEHDLLEEIAPS